MNGGRVKKHLTDREIEEKLQKSIKAMVASDILVVVFTAILGALFCTGLKESAKEVPKLKIMTVIAEAMPYIVAVGLLVYVVHCIVEAVGRYNDIKNKRYFVTYDYVVDKFKDKYSAGYYAGKFRHRLKSGIVFHRYGKVEVSPEEVDDVSYGEKFYIVYCKHSSKKPEFYYSAERYNYIGDHQVNGNK